MLDLISTHLLDMLQADARTYAAGTAWPAGFSGTTRPDAGVTPVAGFVNLFDGSFEQAGYDHRPAVYLGMPGDECTDRLDELAVASGRLELRTLLISLVIAAQAADKRSARQQRDQLRANVRTVLASHLTESGFWYELLWGASGGQAEERLWDSAEGGGAQRSASAICTAPLQVRYVWQPGSAG